MTSREEGERERGREKGAYEFAKNKKVYLLNLWTDSSLILGRWGGPHMTRIHQLCRHLNWSDRVRYQMSVQLHTLHP
jgi:hypothetical protein